MRIFLCSDSSGTLKYCSRGQKIITNKVQVRVELGDRRLTREHGRLTYLVWGKTL